jgi:hypothetical protein
MIKTNKGIFKEHRSVVNSITDLAERYNVRENPEAIILFSTYVFEPFARQILMALLILSVWSSLTTRKSAIRTNCRNSLSDTVSPT